MERAVYLFITEITGTFTKYYETSAGVPILCIHTNPESSANVSCSSHYGLQGDAKKKNIPFKMSHLILLNWYVNGQSSHFSQLLAEYISFVPVTAKGDIICGVAGQRDFPQSDTITPPPFSTVSLNLSWHGFLWKSIMHINE